MTGLVLFLIVLAISVLPLVITIRLKIEKKRFYQSSDRYSVDYFREINRVYLQELLGKSVTMPPKERVRLAKSIRGKLFENTVSVLKISNPEILRSLETMGRYLDIVETEFEGFQGDMNNDTLASHRDPIETEPPKRILEEIIGLSPDGETRTGTQGTENRISRNASVPGKKRVNFAMRLVFVLPVIIVVIFFTTKQIQFDPMPELKKIVELENVKKGRMLDGFTRFDEAILGDRRIFYQLTIVYAKTDIERAVSLTELLSQVKESILAELSVANPERLEFYKKNYITTVYRYQDALGAEVGEINIRPEDLAVTFSTVIDHWTVSTYNVHSVLDVIARVSQNVNYYEVDPLTARRWQFPSETQITKSGDCKDFSSLAVQLLHQIGIDSKFVIARVKMSPNSPISGHALIKVNGQYLEPQNPNGAINYQIVAIDEELDYDQMVALILRNHI